MVLAATLTLNTPARGYDADATAFAAASGATDVSGLSAFVKGVKELGLWSNMVCWPLRSSQNAGTGTTAFSLGGLGTHNGTLVNGPTWGTNGIDINAASSNSITVNPSPLSDFANGHSWFVVLNPTGPAPASGATVDQFVATQGSGTLLQLGAVGTGGTDGFMVNARTETVRHPSQIGNGLSTDRNKFGFRAHDSGSDATTYKAAGVSMPDAGTTATVQTYTGTTTTIAASGDGRHTLALLMVTTPQFNLSATLQAALEALYKQTLGTGLGLP
jgi:hypothetical protein